MNEDRYDGSLHAIDDVYGAIIDAKEVYRLLREDDIMIFSGNPSTNELYTLAALILQQKNYFNSKV